MHSTIQLEFQIQYAQYFTPLTLSFAFEHFQFCFKSLVSYALKIRIHPLINWNSKFNKHRISPKFRQIEF